MNCLRFLSLVGWLCLVAGALGAADAQPQAAFPLWNGQESVEQYAKRVDLPPAKTLDLGNGVSLEFVLIPAGKFIMGTPRPESPWIGGSVLGIAALIVLILAAQVLIRAVRKHRRPQFSLRWLIVVVLILGVAEYGGFRCWRAFWASYNFYSNESPAHEVTLSRPSYMAKFVTTQEQYMQVMGVNPSNFRGPKLPVETVSWEEAEEFCKKIAEKTGQAVRLPTEAEWEFACRAGTTTTYYSGDADTDLGRVAWHGGNSDMTTHPVGQKEPNAFGLYDMLGNVREWCQDWDGEYGAGAATDPTGPATGTVRVLRGGSYGSYTRDYCRSAYRNGRGLDDGADSFSFRLVLAGPP
ncbi:MAG: formylglycine-generating enzyme family protein [Planctomycetota bacterium]